MPRRWKGFGVRRFGGHNSQPLTIAEDTSLQCVQATWWMFFVELNPVTTIQPHPADKGTTTNVLSTRKNFNRLRFLTGGEAKASPRSPAEPPHRAPWPPRRAAHRPDTVRPDRDEIGRSTAPSGPTASTAWPATLRAARRRTSTSAASMWAPRRGTGTVNLFRGRWLFGVERWCWACGFQFWR